MGCCKGRYLIFYIVQSLPEDIKATGQSAVDQVRGTAQPYTDAAADKAQAAKDSLTSNQSTTGSKGISGPGSVSGATLLPAVSYACTPLCLCSLLCA